MTIRTYDTALAALCAASMLAACGGSDAPTSETNTEQAASTTTPVTAAATSPTLADALGIDDLPSITNNTFDKAEEIPTPRAVQHAPQPERTAKAPLTEGTTYHSQNSSYTDEAFAQAQPFNADSLEYIYLSYVPELLDDRVYIETLACDRDEREFERMIDNEFEYYDFITAKQEELKREVQVFSDKLHIDENGQKYALLWGTVERELGDYDFDSESFAFDPFPYDYLNGAIYLSQSCSTETFNREHKKTVAPYYPEGVQLFLRFGPGISALPMPKEKARTYLQSVSDFGEPDRKVKIDMLIKVPLAFEPIPNKTLHIGHTGVKFTRKVDLIQKPTEIVALRVHVPEYLVDAGEVAFLGEFMPAYFGIELPD